MQTPRHPGRKGLPARLQRLIAGGESDTLDFKLEISSPQKIAKTLVSFANHKGGTLLVGVDDDGTVRGVQPEEEAHMLTGAALRHCRPAIPLALHEHPSRKKYVLEAVVPEGTEKPYYALGEDGKWWVYLREGDRTLLASKVMLEVIKRRARDQETHIAYSAREKKLLEYLSGNDSITLKQYCKLIGMPRRQAQEVLINLAAIGMVRISREGMEEHYSLTQKP